MINSIKISSKNQIGGLALLQKYGRQHFAIIGKQGGRPHFRDTLPASPGVGNDNKNILKEVMLGKATLTDLKALWVLKQGTTGNSQSGPA